MGRVADGWPTVRTNYQVAEGKCLRGAHSPFRKGPSTQTGRLEGTGTD